MTAICVVGLGRLGAPLAAVLAGNKHHVIGVDVEPSVVEAVNAGKAPVQETGLGELMEWAHPWLRATTDMAEAVTASSMAFVVVPTPSNSGGQFSIHHVLNAVSEIGTALRDSDKPSYTVVIVSTVMPGATRGPIRQALEQTSQRSCGIDCSIVFAPAFIALGSVIHDFTHPDLILIGCDDDFGGRDVRRALLPILQTEPAWHELCTVDAELAKIALNAYVVTKVSYANMMAELCEHVPGASAQAVLRAVGSDSRIGNKYFLPGAPVGGECFPRDTVALAAFAEEVGAEVPLVKAAHLVNDRQVLRIAAKVVDEKRVGVLGLTYKTDTPITTASLGTRLLDLFEDWDIAAQGYDPMMPGIAASAKDLVEWSTAVIVATPWPEFAGVDYGDRRVIDVWGILPPEDNIERVGESQS